MRYRGYGSPGLGIVGYIIITCVVLWVAVSINYSTNGALLRLLEFRPNDLLHLSRPWTVVTAIFVHAPLQISFTHILFNMLVLYFFGGFLVNLLGSKAFLVIFLAGGIAGNLLFMLMASSPLAPVVGASGAIFAIEGTLVVLRPKLPVFIFPIPAPIPLWAAVIGGFLLTFYAASDVAWQAHLGGLIFGALAGFFFRLRERRRLF